MFLVFIKVFVGTFIFMMGFKLFLHLIEWLGRDKTVIIADKNHIPDMIKEFLKEADKKKGDED